MSDVIDFWHAFKWERDVSEEDLVKVLHQDVPLMPYLRKIIALKAKCDAYEQALEMIVATDIALDMEVADKLESIAVEVLEKYRGE